MVSTRRRGVAAAVTALVALAVTGPVSSPAAAADSRQAQARATVSVEWLGWSHFRMTAPNGTVLLTNPFVTNPDSPVRVQDITRADLIYAPNGHADEVGPTVQIAQRTGARVFAPGELLGWLIEQGVPPSQVPLRFAGPGDRLRFGGVTMRMVNSIHGSGLPMPTTSNPYGGPASGVFITFRNRWTVYFAGSTAATRDQAMWAQMYRPDLAILPLSGGRDPMDFAMQVKQLLRGNPRLRAVMPHHHRVNPQPGQTTIAEARRAMRRLRIRGVRVIEPSVGRVMRFRK